jgi:hypothetical protein
VVDPAHRGRRLLNRLKDAAIDGARELGLLGVFADAVTVHTFTQKANIEHGARLCCADLGKSPRTEKFEGIDRALCQRVTCLLYFLWLAPAAARTVYAPQRHRDALTRLYGNLGCPVTFGEAVPPQGAGELAVRFQAGASRAFLTVTQVGQDTAATIRHAKRQLIEHSHAEALFADLPLTQPGTPEVAEELRKEGFFFGGIAPHFSASGDLLRLIYLTEDLACDSIHIEEEIGRWLVGYALADRQAALASVA